VLSNALLWVLFIRSSVALIVKISFLRYSRRSNWLCWYELATCDTFAKNSNGLKAASTSNELLV
jgi:hypothetical protein